MLIKQDQGLRKGQRRKVCDNEETIYSDNYSQFANQNQILIYSHATETVNKKLYVGNISYDTSKEDLIEFFAKYGFVRDVYIPVDRETGAPRGFAFVTMKAEAADDACEKASGVELQGRIIEVKESLPRGQKAPARERKVNSK